MLLTNHVALLMKPFKENPHYINDHLNRKESIFGALGSLKCLLKYMNGNMVFTFMD